MYAVFLLELGFDGSGVGDLERPVLLVQDGVPAVCLLDAPEILEGNVEQASHDCAVYAAVSCDKDAVALPGLGNENVVDKVLGSRVHVVKRFGADGSVKALRVAFIVVGLVCPTEPRPMLIAVALEEAVAVLYQPEVLVYGDVAIFERELSRHIRAVEWT